MNEHMDTLGLVETRTIAGGARMLDLMLKKAEVEVVKATPICSGRFLIRISGERSEVEAAVGAVAQDAGVIASFVLSRIHPQVIAALHTRLLPPRGQALGLVESRRSASGIAAADAALKRAEVCLARLALAQGINGKSLLVFAGTLADVNEAVAAASHSLGRDLVDQSVIARPEPATATALTGMQPD
nr:BMC domain-containing protein [uncultured Desulfobulbus sp.]